MTDFHFDYAFRTHAGRVRSNNEDSVGALPAEKLWIVADGMGGHSSGQIASKMAVHYVEDFMGRWRREPDFIWPFDVANAQSFSAASLMNAVRVANVRIYNRSLVDPECEQMGTTVVALHYCENEGMNIAHVGDSRCYRLRGGRLLQLTEDHSLAREVSRVMKVSEQAAQERVGSHIILRALGSDDDVNVDLIHENPQLGDIYLLCSDGLTDMVPDERIKQMIAGASINPDTAVEALVEAANEAGGHDNVSALVVVVRESAS